LRLLIPGVAGSNPAGDTKFKPAFRQRLRDFLFCECALEAKVTTIVLGRHRVGNSSSETQVDDMMPRIDGAARTKIEAPPHTLDVLVAGYLKRGLFRDVGCGNSGAPFDTLYWPSNERVMASVVPSPVIPSCHRG
jgi:hypothetical protein